MEQKLQKQNPGIAFNIFKNLKTLKHMIKILLAGEQDIVLNGFKSILSGHSEFTVTGTIKNEEELTDDYLVNDSDILVLDSGNINVIQAEWPGVISQFAAPKAVVALIPEDDEKAAAELFKMGVKGFVLKHADKAELTEAIKKVAAGNYYVSTEISVDFLKRQTGAKGRGKTSGTASLSKRELEVLELIAEGYTNNEIAERLYTSRRTIETHRMNLIDKTGSKNTASLIKFAVLNGIINDFGQKMPSVSN
jgi:DNA-binding NarL/FixJ family response regulator